MSPYLFIGITTFSSVLYVAMVVSLAWLGLSVLQAMVFVYTSIVLLMLTMQYRACQGCGESVERRKRGPYQHINPEAGPSEQVLAGVDANFLHEVPHTTERLSLAQQSTRALCNSITDSISANQSIDTKFDEKRVEASSTAAMISAGSRGIESTKRQVRAVRLCPVMPRHYVKLNEDTHYVRSDNYAVDHHEIDGNRVSRRTHSDRVRAARRMQIMRTRSV